LPELVWTDKYDKDGRRSGPLRVALPFQTVETVNESVQERQQSLDFFTSGRDKEWRNRLIWGDKKYVLPALVDELAGKVDLIYIDPPFFTGDDFSFEVTLDGEEFVKQPSAIEHKAYRDTWGVSADDKRRGMTSLDKYLAWFYETVVLLTDLLTETGSLFVHLDWHVGHYAKTVLDEVFGESNFRNEIIWHYYNKLQGNVNRFASNHDVIFWYSKGEKYTFHRLREEREKPKRQQKRVWDPATGTLKQARDEAGALVYYTETERTIDDVWRLPYLMPADRTENLGFPTQKRRELLDRVIEAASNEGDLVLDCFVGSGTSAESAEVLGRRWIACDLSRFAIHTTRKRLLSVANVKPFVVQNLGKYERQLWQEAEFGQTAAARTTAYRRFILDLDHAKPIEGYSWLHGVKNGRMVHVGTVDAPVTVGDVKQIATEFRRVIGTGKDAPTVKSVDVLGWDFAFELNEVARQEAANAGIEMRFVRIPREVLEKRAVEQGDIKFFELAALGIGIEHEGKQVSVSLTDFVIPLDEVPSEIQSAITSWTQWIDYWAIDWDNKEDTFHNQWQSYRTRKNTEIDLTASYEYDEPGTFKIVVKVIDILGNDTTKTVSVTVDGHAS
jgi:adenine-specific DNA-methyltransferase